MFRIINEAAAIPLDTDFLYEQKFAQAAVSAVLNATIGAGTYYDGLAVTPNSPAGLTVVVAPGSITFVTTADTTVYGSLPIDNTPCTKQGINTSATVISCPAPATAGYSINYLIEATFAENDAVPVVLPYYNAANPSQPFSGPNNTGTAQNTQRQQTVAIQAKAGVPAATGSQATPTVDTGYVPLAVVTVANGQTTITSSSIGAGPPVYAIGQKLGTLPTQMSQNITLYVLNQAANPSASDTNSGLALNCAFASLQGAWNAIIGNYALNSKSISVVVGAGTFSPANFAGSPVGFGATSQISFSGAGSSTIVANSTAGASCIQVQNGANVALSNMQFQSSGYGIISTYGGTCFLNGGLTFAVCTNAHVWASNGTVVINGTETISGNAPYHYLTINGGAIFNNATSGPACTVTGNPNFSGAFVSCDGGYITLVNGSAFPTYTGSATGVKYSVQMGGALHTGGNGGTLPGSSAGTTGSGTAAGFYN